MDAPRWRITYWDPYDHDNIHVYGSPGGHLGWPTKASAEAFIRYMKLCDPWCNLPALADTLRAEEIEN
jgi:hypothetical protein